MSDEYNYSYPDDSNFDSTDELVKIGKKDFSNWALINELKRFSSLIYQITKQEENKNITAYFKHKAGVLGISARPTELSINTSNKSEWLKVKFLQFFVNTDFIKVNIGINHHKKEIIIPISSILTYEINYWN